jgi:hypothetical protein
LWTGIVLVTVPDDNPLQQLRKSVIVLGEHEENSETQVSVVMDCESSSTSLQWTDPQPLLTVPGTPQVGKNFFLDEVVPVKGFVSVAPVSIVWKDRVGGFEVKLTQGLTVSLQVQYSWTIPRLRWENRPANRPPSRETGLEMPC